MPVFPHLIDNMLLITRIINHDFNLPVNPIPSIARQVYQPNLEMDDSPLSIAASITGILTLVAAIFSFVYVRYTILENGRDEMLNVFESVTATLEETQELLARLSIIPGDGPVPRPDRLVRLIKDLYDTELFILAQYQNVFNYRDMDLKNSIASILNRLIAEDPGGAWLDVERKAEEFANPPPRRQFERFWRCFERLTDVIASTHPEYLAMAWAAVRVILSLGVGPSLMRWYRIREQVLEKMKKREMFRSRVMFYLIQTAAM